MALLLKLKKEGKNSIGHMLSRHMNSILVFLILTTLFGVGFYLRINAQFVQSNQRLIQNDEFFLRLLETKNYLYQRLFEICEEDKEFLAQLSGYIENFRMDEISTGYRRDISDLEILFEKYQDMVEKMEAGIARGEPYETCQVFYEEACSLLEMMEEYHQPVLHQLMSYEENLAEIQQRSVLFYTLVFLVTLVLICVKVTMETRRIKQSIIVPLQELTDSIGGVDFLNPQDNVPMEKEYVYKDEINAAIENYNGMLDKLKLQSAEHNELMNTRLQLQEQMYRSLQHQINPHFLFNTLNMIAQTAYLEESEQTVTLIETTAHLLRYSLDYVDREVTLQQELEALSYYVSLQEQRFVEKIQFRFVLDESFHQMKIPSLILQPLVENAISHGGVMYRENGEIQIKTAREPDGKRVRVSVIDNGIGMSPQKLEQTDAAMRRGRGSQEGIGLTNVYFRLSIFFDRKSEIEITSAPGIRTEVALLLPLEQE